RGHALDGLELAAVHLRTEHETGADQPAIEFDAAGAAVARAAAFLGAGQAQAVAQHVKQRLIRFAHILNSIAVDRRSDVNATHYLPPARSIAMPAARRASTPDTLILNSLVPRLSSIGFAAADAAAASLASA